LIGLKSGGVELAEAIDHTVHFPDVGKIERVIVGDLTVTHGDDFPRLRFP
jgi:hypothetical protein